MKKLLGIICLSIVLGACTTTAKIHIPPGSQLYLYPNPDPVTVNADDSVTTRPYFWTAITGIPYRVEQNGVVIRKGKLKSRFRPASIFWPPFAYAAIYWPVGFAFREYDLRQPDAVVKTDATKRANGTASK